MVGNLFSGDVRLFLVQLPIHLSVKGHGLQARQWEHPLHVGKEETLVFNLMMPFIVPSYKYSSSSSMESLNKKFDFLSSLHSSDSSLPSEKTSLKVSALAWVNRVWRSWFFLVNAGAIF